MTIDFIVQNGCPHFTVFLQHFFTVYFSNVWKQFCKIALFVLATPFINRPSHYGITFIIAIILDNNKFITLQLSSHFILIVSFLPDHILCCLEVLKTIDDLFMMCFSYPANNISFQSTSALQYKLHPKENTRSGTKPLCVKNISSN